MKVLTVNNKTLIELSTKLAKNIIDDDWIPDLVIGIKTGGVYVSKPVYDILLEINENIKYEVVSIQRPTTKKKKLFKVDKILKLFPYFILDYLRILEVFIIEKFKPTNYNNKRESEIFFSDNFEMILKNSNRVLVIDDAIDTGTTILATKNILKKLKPKLDIKSAVLTKVHKKTYVDCDYILFDRILLRCPWANDYKEKSEK